MLTLKNKWTNIFNLIFLVFWDSFPSSSDSCWTELLFSPLACSVCALFLDWGCLLGHSLLIFLTPFSDGLHGPNRKTKNNISVLHYRKMMQKWLLDCLFVHALNNLGGFISKSCATCQRYPGHERLAQISEEWVLGLAAVLLGSNTPLLPAAIPRGSEVVAFWTIHKDN